MKLLRNTVAVTLVLGVLPLCNTAATALARPTAISTRDRAAVVSSYNTEFNRVEPGSTWSGDTNTCRSGTTSSAYQQSVLQRVNWYRAMAGLPAVGYDTTLNQNAQDAALISSAEGRLSHTPAATAKCYSESGYIGTSHSNLGLGVSGVAAVDGYMTDPGENNTNAGHRSWLLYRSLGLIATGDVEADDTHYAANAIYVSAGGTTATARDGYVAWPPSGYVPDAVLNTRWSFSVAGHTANFQNATVTVTGPNGAVPVTIESRTGWAESGIVFAPAITNTKVTTDTTYNVSIGGITGGTSSSYTYQVTVVHVNQPPREASVSGWGASTCTSPGSSISQVNLTDPDGDTASYHLVDGYGDTDNTSFKISSTGIIQNIGELTPGKTMYHLRYEAEDENGWKAQGTLRITLKDPLDDTSIVCPGRNLTLKPHSSGGVQVSWANPVTGGAGTWYVFFTPGGSYCSVTTTSCVVTTLQNGTTYKVDLYNVRGSWSVPITVTYTKTASPTSPTTTVVIPALRTLKRGRTARLTSYGAVPVGTKTYKVTGPCSVNRTTISVTASRTTVGVCAISITATTRSKTGALVRKTSQIRLKVV